MHKANKIKQSSVDPVCLMRVDPDATDLKYKYRTNTYYFCAEGCKRSFESNPEKYIGVKRKGIWSRYLDRLTKSTGGKAMKCH